MRNSRVPNQLELFKTPVKIELHTIQVPFFRLDKRHGSKSDFPPLPWKGGGVLIPVHMPGYSAKKLFFTMFKKMTEDIKRYENPKIPVEFSSNLELRSILGKQSINYLRKVAHDLVKATFTQVKVVKNVKTGKFLESYEHIALVRKIVLVGEEYYDLEEARHKVADKVLVYPAEWVIDNIDQFYVHTIDWDLWNNLPPIAQRLYEILSFNFYANKLKPVRYNYSTLAYIIPMSRYKYLSDIMKAIKPHLDKLLEIGYLSDVKHEQIDKHDWRFTFYPGSLAREEIKELAKRREVAKAIEGNKKDSKKEVTKMLNEMPDLPDVDADDIKLMVHDILEVTRDRHSKRFYELVARKVPHEKLRELLSVLKADYLVEGRNEKSPGALFVGMVKEWVKRRRT